MKKPSLALCAFFGLLLFSSLLSACSGATNTPAAAATTAPAKAGGGAVNAPVAGATPAPGAANNPIQPSVPLDRLIIRNATINLISQDVEKTIGDIRAVAIDQQGWVANSNSSLRGDQTYAQITLQVPTTAYDNTMVRLRKIAYKVESENSTSQDVTEEFVDTESQIRNLKITEAQLQELLKKATTLSDTLSIQKELTAVRGEIEKRQGRVNFLQRKAEFSTITINISPLIVAEKKEEPKTDWDFGKAIGDAWKDVVGVLQWFANVAVTLIVHLTWLTPLVLVLVLLWFGFKKLLKIKI